MKQIKKWLVVILMFTCIFALVGCKNNPTPNDPIDPNNPDNPSNPQNPEVKVPTISLTLGSETIKQGETVDVTVEVKDAENSAYTITFSDPTLLKHENGKISVIKQGRLDKMVTVTATLDADKNVTASKTIKYVAPVEDGRVGDLTSDMIAEIGNAAITVTGTLTDVYQDFNQSQNSAQTNYKMTVKMSDGMWYGSWYAESKPRNVLTNIYRRGAVDGIKNPNSIVSTGHALEELIINKDNEVEARTVKDYLSLPGIWENQHLWNHLGNLQISKFTYDAENDIYAYATPTTEDDLFLMTYLSICLTPMLEDTLVNLYLKVEDGKVTKIIGQTEIQYLGGENREDASAMAYTKVELDVSEVGTTVVPEPTPYTAPQFVEKLQAALDKMSKASNYTFRAVDTTTYAPSTDPGEYETESVNPVSQAAKMSRANPLKRVINNVSAVGTVGSYGKVTKDVVLIGTTTKYSYSMDGLDYKTEYTGYKQNSDGTYDYFEYDSKANTFYGKRKITGTLSDTLPKFEFSPNLFKFQSMQPSETTDGYVYTFVLQATTITRDIAMEVSSYRYAKDAAQGTNNTLTLVVDDEGNLISSIYPYSLVSGTYAGYVSTTYSHIDSTKIDDDQFDGYIPRTVPTSWDQYTMKYYSATHSTLDSHDESASVAIDAIWGDNKTDLPSPSIFHKVFDDNVSGPFYSYKEAGTDAEGNKIWIDYFDLTARSDYYDENAMVTNFDEIVETLTVELGKEGFVLSKANTDLTGGPSGVSNKYVCFIKGECQIVIENNRTKNFWIYFYKTGDWSLNK